MCDVIYTLKIYLFRTKLGFSAEDIAKMEGLVIFIIYHYLEYWFLSQSAQHVQFLDLKFYKAMTLICDRPISNAILKKME